MGWPWQRKEKQAQSEPVLEPLSDRQYEQLFLALLRDVEEGKSLEQLQARLGRRQQDNNFVSWLRRFGRSQLDNPVGNIALGQQMVALAKLDLHPLSVLSGEIGEQLLVQATAPRSETLSNEPQPAQGLDEETAAEETDKRAEFYFYQGNEAYFRGDMRGAIAAYDQALSIKPDLHEALYNKGISLANLGRDEESIAAYNQALSIKPDYHEALSNKGNSLANLGRDEESIAAYDQALSIKPDYHEALSSKGNSLANLGRYEESIAAYDQALSIKPDNHKVLSNKGASLANLGRYEESIAAYDQALSIKPDLHEAWSNRGVAAGNSHQCRTPVAFSLPISLQDESLDQRGYKGKIACYTIGFNHVQKSKNPEGWGQLHHNKGRAHYFYGRFRPDANDYLRQAAESYETALTTLTAFPSSHLKALQDAIRAHLSLNQPEKASEYRQQGLEVFNQLLNAAPTPKQKQRLEQKFSGFSQIQVDSLIRDSNPTQALQTAERYKNRTLGWILDTWQESSAIIPSWADMQFLLQPTTATLYWHLSPDTLTTFLLTAEATAPITFTQPTATLKSWLKKWNRQYQAYRGKGKAAEANKDFDTWRTGLQYSLDELKAILKISELEAYLQNVSQLLLIPHRDLHCLPLHALFSDQFTISHLPSLQVGLTLKQRTIATTPRADLPLLTIADPSGDTLRLESAKIEATLISQQFNQVDAVKSDDATTQTVTAKLHQPNRIFNFSGHAEAEHQPKHSALYLQDKDRLTAETICQLNLKTYDLITLSACETAVTGIQTIESDYVGLVSAFLTAGSANIVSTLWTVESESNAWLMVKFYQHYVAGDSPAVALQKAQHWLRSLTYADLTNWLQVQQNQLDDRIHSNAYDAIAARIGDIQSDPSKIESEKPYADPYYWAAFTVTGYLS